MKKKKKSIKNLMNQRLFLFVNYLIKTKKHAFPQYDASAQYPCGDDGAGVVDDRGVVGSSHTSVLTLNGPGEAATVASSAGGR